jgi:hypothetical protein
MRRDWRARIPFSATQNTALMFAHPNQSSQPSHGTGVTHMTLINA